MTGVVRRSETPFVPCPISKIRSTLSLPGRELKHSDDPNRALPRFVNGRECQASFESAIVVFRSVFACRRRVVRPTVCSSSLHGGSCLSRVKHSISRLPSRPHLSDGRHRAPTAASDRPRAILISSRSPDPNDLLVNRAAARSPLSARASLD